jgi:hypothetical protein
MLLDARIALRPMSLADVPLLELGGRTIGAMQIIDPHTEATHYWGRSSRTYGLSTSGSGRQKT